MDLNGDIGEYFSSDPQDKDAAMLLALSSANIACGFHAGDPLTMLRTVRECDAAGVTIGAHPSYPDPAGFGRRFIQMSREDLFATIVYQVSALSGIATSLGLNLRYVKAHGALYNRAFFDADEANVIADAVVSLEPQLTILGQPKSALEEVAYKRGLAFAREGYADRRYDRFGALVPRSEPGAVIENIDQQIEQAVSLATGRGVTAIDGSVVELPVDSICVHGDSPGATDAAHAIRLALESRGIGVGPFC